MSRETDYLLRLNSEVTNEVKATAFQITDTPILFESSLVPGNKRKGLFFYNNSNSASGECYWGSSDVTTQTGQVIPKGVQVEIPVSESINLYFVTETGETADFRVLEIA